MVCSRVRVEVQDVERRQREDRAGDHRAGDAADAGDDHVLEQARAARVDARQADRQDRDRDRGLHHLPDLEARVGRGDGEDRRTGTRPQPTERAVVWGTSAAAGTTAGTPRRARAGRRRSRAATCVSGASIPGLQAVDGRASLVGSRGVFKNGASPGAPAPRGLRAAASAGHALARGEAVRAQLSGVGRDVTLCGLGLCPLPSPARSAAGSDRPRGPPPAVPRSWPPRPRGRPAGSQALLREGASPDAADRSGWTALHEAAQRGDLATAGALLDAGATARPALPLRAGRRSTWRSGPGQSRAGAAAAVARGARGSGKSIGDTVCVRPWQGDGYCGTDRGGRRRRVRGCA